MKKVEDLKIKIFADGADKMGMLEMSQPTHSGLDDQSDTNEKVVLPTAAFARHSHHWQRKTVTIEVFSDDFSEMGPSHGNCQLG